MTSQVQNIRNDATNEVAITSNWNNLYILGGASALLIVLTGLAEIIITFLPGGYSATETVVDWFTLLHGNWFLGLRNLGLLNIIMVAFGIPLFLALYAAHRKVNQPFAALATVIAFIGIAVFYGTNRAFPMLALSSSYVTASTEVQRTMIEAAGQALLSVGQSHTPGTFMAFFLAEIADILMALVMLRGRVFSRWAAFAGIVGFGCLFTYDILASFVPALHEATLLLAMVGGIASMIWYIMIAIRLFLLGSGDPDNVK